MAEFSAIRNININCSGISCKEVLTKIIKVANKPFKSKDFSNSLGISRVSFAPEELMENILGVKIGAATVFGVLMDKDNLVQVVFDKDVLLEEWYGCSDGTTTGYMKVKTKQIVNNFLTYTNHIPTLIQIY